MLRKAISEIRIKQVVYVVTKEFPVLAVLVGLCISQVIFHLFVYKHFLYIFSLSLYLLPKRFFSNVSFALISGVRLGALAVILSSPVNSNIISQFQTLKVLDTPKIALNGQGQIFFQNSEGKKFRCRANVSQSSNILSIKKSHSYYAKISSKNGFCKLLYISQNKNLKETKISLIKNHISFAINKHFKGEISGIFHSMLLGDSNSIARHTKDLFKQYGIYHLLIVSGFHVALVYGICFFVLSFVFKLLPVKFRLKAILVKIFCLFITLFYLGLTDFNASGVRAGISLLIYNLASIGERGQGFMRNIFFSLLIISLFEPFSVLNIGTQFSYLALLGLCFITEPFKNKRFKLLNAYFIVWMLTSIISIFYFDFFSIIGVISSFTLVPFFTLLIFQISLPILIFSEIFNLKLDFLFTFISNLFDISLSILYFSHPYVENLNIVNLKFTILVFFVFSLFCLFKGFSKYLHDRGVHIKLRYN